MDAPALTFGQRHFGHLELGDKRRSARLPRLVDAMCRHPGGTLPQKLSEPADLRSLYRLVNTPEVTHEAVMKAHYQTTRGKIEQTVSAGHTVLIVHDATELDYSSKTTLVPQLGQIGQGTNRGYICHNSLAIRADTKEVLGLTSQILHHRADVPRKETVKQRRERENRESRLWVQGARRSAVESAPGRVVDVSDSLSDTFEYMAFEIGAKRSFVLRARENRKLVRPINGQQYLFDAIRTRQAADAWESKIPSGPGRTARTASLRISFTPVEMNVPGKRTGDYPDEPLSLWAVRIWEPHPPREIDPLEWILLTNVEVSTVEQARTHGEWYQARFVIEEYHKRMKTGCGIEELQLTEVQRLEPAIGILSVLTTQLLQLRDAARSPDAEERDAGEVVDTDYIDVLKMQYAKRLRGPVSVKEFYMHVARLGGHQNRKGDGFPGWLTLWRGWMKLESMTQGYRLAKRNFHKTCAQT